MSQYQTELWKDVTSPLRTDLFGCAMTTARDYVMQPPVEQHQRRCCAAPSSWRETTSCSSKRSVRAPKSVAILTPAQISTSLANRQRLPGRRPLTTRTCRPTCPTFDNDQADHLQVARHAVRQPYPGKRHRQARACWSASTACSAAATTRSACRAPTARRQIDADRRLRLHRRAAIGARHRHRSTRVARRQARPRRRQRWT